MLRRYIPQAVLAGCISASFMGCSLPTGKYAQVHYREPSTGSHLGTTDNDPAVSDLSATTNGISNPTQPGFGGGGGH